MNQRERVLAVILLSLTIAGVGGFVYFKVYRSLLDSRELGIARLRTDINEKKIQLAEMQRDQQRFARYRQLSLPANVSADRPEYQKYLEGLIRRSGFGSDSYVRADNIDANSSPKLPGKKDPIYTSLPFTATLHGDLASLVDLLTHFYSTGLLQRISNLSIQRPTTTSAQQKPGTLDITLKIEALVLNGAEERTQLLPGVDRRLLALDMASVLCGGPAAVALIPYAVGPTGPLGPHLLAHHPDEYAAIAGKNIFTGPSRQLTADRDGSEVDVSRFVYLTDITATERRVEAWLYNRYTSEKTRFRAEPDTRKGSAGFRDFKIMDDDGEPVVKGRIIRIDERDVIFQADEKYYSLHVGQSLAEAMRKPLPEEKVKTLKEPAAKSE